jgi:hypothetical protein
LNQVQPVLLNRLAIVIVIVIVIVIANSIVVEVILTLVETMTMDARLHEIDQEIEKRNFVILRRVTSIGVIVNIHQLNHNQRHRKHHSSFPLSTPLSCSIRFNNSKVLHHGNQLRKKLLSFNECMPNSFDNEDRKCFLQQSH